MQTIPSITTVVNGSSSFSLNLSLKIKNLNNKPHSFSSPSKIFNREIPPSAQYSSSPPHVSVGLCRASQVADLFPTTSPEVIVREARIEDCWEVAETHCSCFFPEYSFPLDFVLRFDRLVGSDDFKIGGLEGKISLNKGYVAGILTVDTVADFLPRKGPLRQRRRGIAYISNVAVRENFRRKGLAKRLIAKSEAKAKAWGCRAIALHCDLSNPGATKLYTSEGFKVIKIPEGANWPHPRLSADVKFNFMMKLLDSKSSNT